MATLDDVITALARIESKLDRLYFVERAIQQTEDLMAADLTLLQAQVQQNTDTEQSAITLLNGLSALLTASATDPVKVQALADSLKASATSLAAAIVANTPAHAPPTPPALSKP